MARLLPIALLLACGALAFADEKKDATLVDTLKAFLEEKDPEARATKGFLIAAGGAKPADVAAALPKARTWSAEAPKDSVEGWKFETPDGNSHTVLASIPASYDPSKPTPVLIWLHGGVARPTDGGGVTGIRLLKEKSDDEGFILLSPSTRKGAEWWTSNGVALIRGALAHLKAQWHVDADRVAVSGFSDGASGCFHLLAHDPDPYCCFMPLMAQPGVTRLIGGPSFAANVRSRPVFAVNGGADTLYPSAQIKPMIQELKAAGCDITWTDMPDTRHNVVEAMAAHWEDMLDFMRTRARKPLAKQILWETALPKEEGRFGWIEILAVDPKAPSAKGMDAAVLPDPTGRPKLGIQLDQTYRGEGLRIRDVQEDTPAFEAGMEAGDVILAVDGTELGAGPAAIGVLRKALDTLKDRDGTFTLLRGEDEVEVKTRPRPVKSSLERPADRGYGAPSGRVEAKVEGNEITLRTRHVKRLKLHIADGLVDLAKPVRVVVNGTLRHEGLVKSDVGYLLTEAVRGGPGAPVFEGSLTLVP